jgi:HEPN domain-containing protein
MSPTKRAVAGSAQDWIDHATSDLTLATIDRGQYPNILLDTLCFHAQQSAEKAFKAVLIHHGVEIPRTHNLQTLQELVAQHVPIPSALKSASTLTDYAVNSRYPSAGEEYIDEEEWQSATALARQVLLWAQSVIGTA